MFAVGLAQLEEQRHTTACAMEEKSHALAKSIEIEILLQRMTAYLEPKFVVAGSHFEEVPGECRTMPVLTLG